MLESTFNRLVVVSNRLPLVLNWEDNKWKVSPASGGLVTALVPVLSKNGGVWLGWPGTSEKEDVEKPIKEFSDQQGYDLKSVYLTTEDVQGYYYGFSNEVLWPLLHGFHNRCNFNYSYWNKYLKVNNIFAQEINKIAEKDDYIWIQDYHLMCVAHELKKMGSQLDCGFFLHIPFPGPEIFLKLPWRKQILSALLDYDLLGFQTHGDMINFSRCLECLCQVYQQEISQNLLRIKCGSKKVKAGCFPISIDFDQFAEKAASKEISRRTAQLSLLHSEQQIILGIDRLDYTKGIPQRLEALREVFVKYPELRGKIALLQVLVPSRESVQEYQLLKEEIERLVGEINGQFTEPGWIPIHYLYRSLSQEELTSFYLTAQMAMITPLWDGMNLVAKEYCACNYRENGVLILSEFAGAATQLYQDAVLVNPYDVKGVAAAIRRSFYMDKEERKARMKRLRQVIKQYDIHFWLDSFMDAAFKDMALPYSHAGLATYLSKID